MQHLVTPSNGNISVTGHYLNVIKSILFYFIYIYYYYILHSVSERSACIHNQYIYMKKECCNNERKQYCF